MADKKNWSKPDGVDADIVRNPLPKDERVAVAYNVKAKDGEYHYGGFDNKGQLVVHKELKDGVKIDHMTGKSKPKPN
jgi:hypothetical protein